MTLSTNPYEILQIADFSSIVEVEAAFNEKKMEFEKIGTLTAKQSELYIKIHEAYDILCDQVSKKMVDEELRFQNITDQNLRVEDNLSPHDEANAKTEPEVEELSREKNIGISAKKNGNPFFIYFMYALIAVVAVSYFLNFSDKKNKVTATQSENKPTPQFKESMPPEPISLIASPTEIGNNILFPNPEIFKQNNLIYAPDGSILPTESGLIPSLPQTTDGQGSIVIINPHPTAIFGKLVVKFTESTQPTVIRYFYIPSKESLELIKTPSGRYQIQILTLDHPVAYVSPVFNVPLYNDSKTIKKADWDFPHDPASVF